MRSDTTSWISQDIYISACTRISIQLSSHLAPSVSNFKAACFGNYFYIHGESQSPTRLMHIAHARARHEKLYVNFARLFSVVDCFALHHNFVYRKKKNALKSFFLFPLARQGFLRAST